MMSPRHHLFDWFWRTRHVFADVGKHASHPFLTQSLLRETTSACNVLVVLARRHRRALAAYLPKPDVSPRVI